MSFWVNKKTGEVHEADGVMDGGLYEEVPGYEFLSVPEFTAPDVLIEDRSWVVDWYLRRKAEIEARLVARKASFKAGEAEDKSALRCLDWRYLEEVQELAYGLLAAQKGKPKKSVNTTFGKVGFRKDTKILVQDEEAAIFWLLERDDAHPAVKLTPSILKKELPAGEEIPGVKWPSGDVFFAKPSGG